MTRFDISGMVGILLACVLSGCGAKKDSAGNSVLPPNSPTANPDRPKAPPAGDQSTIPGKEEPGAKSTLSREDFRKLIVGKSKAEVQRALGEPETTGRDGDDEYWYYRDRTTNADGTVDERAMVSMRKGIVQRVTFKPRD